MSRPFARRASRNNRFVAQPDALDNRPASLHLAPMESLRTIAEKRLAAVLEAPARFDVAGLDVRAAALAGVERNLLAIRLVFGEGDRLHVDTGSGIFIYFRVRNGHDLQASATPALESRSWQ